MARLSLILLILAAFPALASAQDVGEASAAPCPPAEDAVYDEYGEAGTIELGGSLGFTWDPHFWSISAIPSVGVFLFDYFEISAYLDFEYESEEDENGERTDATFVSAIVEPSYHYPLAENAYYLLGGLGVGVGYDGTTAGFELIPRVGLNIVVTEHGVLTPSVRVPMIMGVEDDEATGESGFDASAELVVDVGYTTYF